MKQLQLLFLLICLSLTLHILPTTVITTPGPFTFGNDQTYSPSGDNDVAFEIAVSDVTFDMNGFKIIQDLTTGFVGLTAIKVNPGLQNIIIQNGTLLDITGTGITIGAGCSNIDIINVNSNDIGDSALSCVGSAGAPITNIEIISCEFGTSSTLIDSTTTAFFQNCTNLTIENTELLQNGNPNALLDVAFLLSCTRVNISNCLVEGNSATGINGLHLNGTSEVVIINTNSLDNASSGTTVNGFIVDNGSSGIIFNNCVAQGNSTAGGSFIEARGFSVFDSSACDFQNCQARGNQSISTGTAVGFTAINSSLININSCLATGNKAPSGDAFGIFWNNNSQSTIRNTISQSNTGSNSSIGCKLNNCTQYSLLSNQFFYNNGATFNRGLIIINGSQRFAVNNSAFNNGTTAQEQIDGLQSSETSDFDTGLNNLNGSITNYWSNVRAF